MENLIDNSKTYINGNKMNEAAVDEGDLCTRDGTHRGSHSDSGEENSSRSLESQANVPASGDDTGGKENIGEAFTKQSSGMEVGELNNVSVNAMSDDDDLEIVFEDIKRRQPSVPEVIEIIDIVSDTEDEENTLKRAPAPVENEQIMTVKKPEPIDEDKVCKICCYIFPKKEQRYAHMKHAHPQLMCIVCKKIFANETETYWHRVDVHVSTPCPTCGEIMEKIHIDDHWKRVHNKTCIICGLDLKSPEILHIHQRKLHPDLLCETCDNVFSDQSTLRKHECSPHSSPQMCNICIKWFDSQFLLDRHVGSAHPYAVSGAKVKTERADEYYEYYR